MVAALEVLEDKAVQLIHKLDLMVLPTEEVMEVYLAAAVLARKYQGTEHAELFALYGVVVEVFLMPLPMYKHQQYLQILY